MRTLRACGLLLALIGLAALLSEAGARRAPDKEKDKEEHYDMTEVPRW